MFQLSPEFSPPPTALQRHPNPVENKIIDSVLLGPWEEHCQECGWPMCFESCALYAPNNHGGCSRFAYGIVPNTKFEGLFNFGADITFKKWGKLELNLQKSFSSPHISSFPIQNDFQNHGTFSHRPYHLHWDAFILECYCEGGKKIPLCLEYFTEHQNIRHIQFRKGLELSPGYNFMSIPFSEFPIYSQAGYLNVYPQEDSVPARIIFTWLNFVVFKKEKIKCVIWDLDNTLWNGVLSEGKVQLFPHVVPLIKALDDRGIVQSIVSKNEFSEAWNRLNDLGLADYFLFPQINWSPKSNNVKKIAQELNLDTNTFAVFDDSPFERAEISGHIPECRVFPVDNLAKVIRSPDFVGPISEDGKKRRLYYQNHLIRNQQKKHCTGTYIDFLKSCDMELTVFSPKTDTEVKRCWELIQRTHQLNLKGNLYTFEDFKAQIIDPTIKSIALRCKDRFGDYGLIGYCSFERKSSLWELHDFVLSCRIAEKKVEHTFFKNLKHIFPYEKEISIHLIKMAKNKRLQQVFEELPTKRISSSACEIHYHFFLQESLPYPDIMKINLSKEVSSQVI